MAGVSEALVVILMAAKFGVPVCPHGGGVGLCEYVQHLSFFDAIALGGRATRGSASTSTTCTSTSSTRASCGAPATVAPEAPGTSIAMKPESLDTYEFPGGAAWRD